jgi:hypothetical protein
MTFRNGKFKMHSYLSNADYVIERLDSTQTEKDVKTGVVITEKVIWNSPCQYDLQRLSTTNPNPEMMDTFLINSRNLIHVNIIATSKDYYVSSTELAIRSMKVTFTDTIRLVP